MNPYLLYGSLIFAGVVALTFLFFCCRENYRTWEAERVKSGPTARENRERLLLQRRKVTSSKGDLTEVKSEEPPKRTTGREIKDEDKIEEVVETSRSGAPFAGAGDVGRRNVELAEVIVHPEVTRVTPKPSTSQDGMIQNAMYEEWRRGQVSVVVADVIVLETDEDEFFDTVSYPAPAESSSDNDQKTEARNSSRLNRNQPQVLKQEQEAEENIENVFEKWRKMAGETTPRRTPSRTKHSGSGDGDGGSSTRPKRGSSSKF